MPTSKESLDSNWDRFRDICYRQALKMLKNSAMAEDAAHEALLLALPHIQAGKIKNPGAYLRQVTRNYCLEILKTPVDVSLSTPIQGKNEGADFLTRLDLVPARPESEEKSSINPFEALIKEDPQKAQGIMKSIEYVDELFKYKKRIRQRKSEGMILFETRQVIYAACKRLHLPVQRSEKLKRYLMLRERAPYSSYPVYKVLENEPGYILNQRTAEEEVEWPELCLDSFRLDLEDKFHELRSHIDGYIYGDPVFNPLIIIGGLFKDVPGILKMKIAPIKFFINIWHRALKRGGRYGNLELIKQLALHFKKEYENTPQAYLFSGLTDKNFNTLRKRSLYSRNKSFQKIAKEIYRRSFLAQNH